jgi:hypothetical protein
MAEVGKVTAAMQGSVSASIADQQICDAVVTLWNGAPGAMNALRSTARPFFQFGREQSLRQVVRAECCSDQVAHACTLGRGASTEPEGGCQMCKREQGTVKFSFPAISVELGQPRFGCGP